MLYTHLYVVIISVRIIMCVGVGGVTYWVFLFHFGPVLGTLVLCVCVWWCGWGESHESMMDSSAAI